MGDPNIERLEAENENLREFITASEECAKANDILYVYEENERYRKAFAEAINNLQTNGSVRSAHCNWCGEKWPMLDGESAEVAFEHSKRHALRCKSNPMRIERDAVNEENARLESQLTALCAALREACEIADELGYGHGDIPAHRRIAALRRLAGET